MNVTLRYKNRVWSRKVWPIFGFLFLGAVYFIMGLPIAGIGWLLHHFPPHWPTDIGVWWSMLIAVATRAVGLWGDK